MDFIPHPHSPKRTRFTNYQLGLLENSFWQDSTLDKGRKMKLAEEVGLKPRQVATWFKNRRARWKANHLEHSYYLLKQEFEKVFWEKQILQYEVFSLRAAMAEKFVGGAGEESIGSVSVNQIPTKIPEQV